MPHPTDAMLRGRRILVIASEDAVRRRVAAAFAPHGVLLAEASTAAAANEAVAREPWDLFIARWVLPDARGSEVTRVLKQDERSSDTPIIMLVAGRDRVDFPSGIGADCTMQWPLDGDELVMFAGRIFASLAEEDLRG